MGLLLLITAASGLSWRLWRRSVPLLLALALLVGALAALLPAGTAAPAALQRPPVELRLQPGPRKPAARALGHPWVLLRAGPLVVTRRSAELGLNGATLLFTLVHSANLLLLSTSPNSWCGRSAGCWRPWPGWACRWSGLASPCCFPCASCPWCRRSCKTCCDLLQPGR